MTTTTMLSAHSWRRSLALFLCGMAYLPSQVSGAASEPLLGGAYEPMTDVDYIEDLTMLLNAIALENNQTDGQDRYQQIPPDGISLESLGSGMADQDGTFDTPLPAFMKDSTNPLYSIYMYSLWRSHHGSGKDDTDEVREDMEFLGEPVDYYAHTIINDEFTKESGYDSVLTAETIRATNMWMGTVQSLYDAVEMCDEAEADADSPLFVSPVDQAAAFWFGDLDDPTNSTALSESASMYAWAANIKNKFVLDPDSFDANESIVRDLKLLQTKLTECLDRNNMAEDEEDYSLGMRVLVDDITRYMTVPLVQSLIHHAGDVVSRKEGGLDEDAEKNDYMILYGLVAIPPIRICDADAYDDLYSDLIVNAKEMDSTTLYDALTTLYARLVCLGIQCDWIGTPAVLTGVGNGWPTCHSPATDLRGYKFTDEDLMIEYLKVDLDIRTIGTLIEMDSNMAAYDVYTWGRFQRDINEQPVAIQDIALEPYHTRNTVGNSFDKFYSDTMDGTVTFADHHQYRSMMGLVEFEAATPTQRRIITEATMVTITFHAFAMNCMYKAIDMCRDDAAPDKEHELHWDKAFASLSGWAEEYTGASGFMFMEIARFECEQAGTCNQDEEDSEINKLLIQNMKSGKESLRQSPPDCDGAESKLKEVELLLQTILVDVVAYFAEQVEMDPTNADTLAEAYGVATALIPLIAEETPMGASLVASNMGQFGPEGITDGDPFSKSEVFDALRNFVADAGINCMLLTRQICDDGVGSIPQTSPTGLDLSGEGQGPTGVTSGGTPTRSPSYYPTSSSEPTYDDDDEHPWGSEDEAYCDYGVGGGVPNNIADTSVSSGLLGGAYTPTSNVDHIIALTTNLQQISNATDETYGLEYYQERFEETSLQCLSTGSRFMHTESNPIYLIYMYGLWISDDGDNDSDGYSNKLFDDGPLLMFGDTIVMDEFEKSSGFDSNLSAETIKVMNVWMAVTKELYRAAQSCRDGYASKSPQGFNPVDFAAALWYGDATNPDSTEGASLYAWAKLKGTQYTDQSMGATGEITSLLKDMQQKFNDCKSISDKNELETKGIEMKHMADEITRWMTVPLLQNFISHLADESGLTDSSGSDQRNYMVLSALTVLPFISICDEDVFDDLFFDLITEIDVYDTSTFKDHLKLVQDRYQCLGITCDMVGRNVYAQDDWPECTVKDVAFSNGVPVGDGMKIAGYEPTSNAALEIMKIDLDISTVLSFIIMDASDAALDIYKNGRNVKTNTNTVISLQDLSIPSSNQDAISIYQQFSSNATSSKNYAGVTKDAIMGEGPFFWSSILKNSAAASMAIATIDMHMAILDHMYEATDCDSSGSSPDGWDEHWDISVASAVGWTENTADGSGVNVDGYLFYQLAEELCEHYDNCDNEGESLVNQKLMQEFKNGQDRLKNNQCDEAKLSRDKIERYLQALLVDNLAYHARFADSERDERHCLMAHVAKNAIVPLIRHLDSAAADVIEENVGATALECKVDNVTAVYTALNDFVSVAGVQCDWLGSSVCTGDHTVIDLENDSQYTENEIEDNPDTALNEAAYLLYGEYEPLTDMKDLQKLSNVVDIICDADSTTSAKNVYDTDESPGITIKTMSTSAKYAMDNELQFNQYVYALQDSVDKTKGTLQFDNKPAGDYADTVSGDALDTSITLGCLSIKVLNIWMWTVHKLNDVIEACKMSTGWEVTDYGVLDEAAALWEGGQLFDMAEQLGPKFGHTQIGGMTSLNRQIVDRIKKAQDIISLEQKACDNDQVHDLRIIVKEIISYMTAVLIQNLINSMLDVDTTDREKEEMVELMAFATLPHIKTCGHESTYDLLYKNLITAGFKKSMVGDTISVLQSHYNCLGLTCSDVGLHINEDANVPACSDNLDIVGYTPANVTKTNMIAKLDLDAVAIHQLMSMDKYEVARRIYTDGHNYYDYDNKEKYNFVSLYNMTLSQTIDFTDFQMFTLYEDYMEVDDFADFVIKEALDKNGIFQNTTAAQRGLAVSVAISSLISYMAALEALYFAASVCSKVLGSAELKAAETAFDGAVALLVGSVEGRVRGGSQSGEGQMLYSTSKRMCEHFRSCGAADAEVNIDLTRAFTEGQTFLKQGDCGEFSKVVEAMNALLKVPLFQSLLYFADPRISKHADDDAAGYVAAMAVLPIIDHIDTFSADGIKSTMDFNKGSSMSPGSSGSKQSDVTSALEQFFSNPKSKDIIDCELVTNRDDICNPLVVDDGDEPYEEEPIDNGDPNISNGNGNQVVEPTPGDDIDTSAEPEEPQVIEPEKPVVMSNGLYVSTNYVGDRSAIALDVQEIEERLKANDFDRANDFYAKGLNSKFYNTNGIPTGKLRSIASFSTESGMTMRADPTYNLYIHGLSDENHEFRGRPTAMYADSLISDLLLSELPEASNAMVAITIWMQVAHSLHSAYGACKSSFLQDGRTNNGRFLQDNSPSFMLDEAAAYWIGDKQATGSSSKGHLLYALTEFIGDKFERIPEGSESIINTQILDLFNKAKNHIAISRGCSTSDVSHLKLKGIVDELVTLMAVPLLRCLLYYMSTNEPVMVKVYAVAVLPLFSVCAPSVYNELKDELIDHDGLGIQKNYLYSKIQNMYSCLGLTCDLVGSMLSDEALQCDDSSEIKSLAGYSFNTGLNDVNRASHMDIAMRKVEILIDNGMNHFQGSEELLFGTASDLYTYGQHSSDIKGFSLSQIARDTNRDVTDGAFTAFKRYFKSDENYADTLIVNAFQKIGVFQSATFDERKRVIVFTLKYMVTYMSILEKLYSALRSCKENDRVQGSTNLDMAAGYYVGSMEGNYDGGSFDGYLIHMLAKRMCVHFGTCSSLNHAMINERIISLFYAGQGEVETGACTPLAGTIKEIENALIVPLIQATLLSALENEFYFEQGVSEGAEFYPEGYALALSILPVIDAVDRSSAKDIEAVMVDGFPGPDHIKASDYAKVFRAIQTSVSKMDGVDCAQIGSLEGKGFCPGDDVSYEGIKVSPATSSTAQTALLVITGTLIFAMKSSLW